MSAANLRARARIRVRAMPADVFAAFADANKMSKFWFDRKDDRLTEGKDSVWSLGSGPNAFSFEVRVVEIREPEKIVIEWPGEDDHLTQVVWLFEEADNGDTILSVEESGFSDGDATSISRVIDSTGGFNQVVVAAKALVEHGVEINVVTDHV